MATDRKRVDWEAVERDYRTGHYSQIELCTKHGIAEATLSRKIKRDREAIPGAWARDLTEVVRQATNARVMAELVKSEVKDGQVKVKDAVDHVAGLGANIILHQQRALESFERDVQEARSRLLRMAESIADVKEAALVVQALESSGRTIQRIHDGQRKAHNLDEQKDATPGGALDTWLRSKAPGAGAMPVVGDGASVTPGQWGDE